MLGHENKADKWTILGAVVGILAATINNFLFWGSTTDNVFNWNTNSTPNITLNFNDQESITFLGLSLQGALLGLLISILVSGSSAYCNYIVNLKHQDKAEEPQDDSSLIKQGDRGSIQEKDALVEVQGDTEIQEMDKQSNLSKCQILLLALAATGCSGQLVGTANYLIKYELTRLALAPNLIRQYGLISNAGLFALGYMGAAADIRTYIQNLRDSNSEKLISDDSTEEIDETEGDCISKIGFVSEIIKGSIDNFLLWGQIFSAIVSLARNSTNNVFLNMSLGGIIPAAIFAAFISISSAYCHYKLNSMHQDSALSKRLDLVKSSGDIGSLSKPQIAALIGDGAGHSGELVAASNFLTKVAAPKLNGGLSLGISFTFFFGGLVAATADMRTCRNNLKKCNSLEYQKNFTSEPTH